MLPSYQSMRHWVPMRFIFILAFFLVSAIQSYAYSLADVQTLVDPEKPLMAPSPFMTFRLCCARYCQTKLEEPHE